MGLLLEKIDAYVEGLKKGGKEPINYATQIRIMKDEIDEADRGKARSYLTALRLMLEDPNDNHEIIRAICTRMAKSYERVLPLYMIANETMESIASQP
ncbi:MAG: hypothetical protein OK439_02185 [Thaumarchaeota archaeon]|nr:hypothetical protein [Nitrososphaerota archaeon]